MRKCLETLSFPNKTGTMKLLLQLFSIFIAKGERSLSVSKKFSLKGFCFILEPFLIKSHQSKSNPLGLRESYSDRSSIRKGMSSFYCSQDEIHLPVNGLSSGRVDHYSKVISMSPTRQGRKRLIEIGKIFFYDGIKFDFRFLIHGWGSDLDSFFLAGGTEAYLKNDDFNVIKFVAGQF